MLSIQKAQKSRRSSERNSKNRPKNRLKSPQNRSKVSKQVKLNKIFLSHYQGVEVLDQKKDFKIFGQN